MAEIIANGLGSHGLAPFWKWRIPYALKLDAVDLMVIGGPTQAHRMSPALRAYPGALIADAPVGMTV